MTTLRMTIFLLALAFGLSASGDAVAKTAPLFTSNDILDVTIRAPFTTIMKERSDDEDLPATLTYTDAEEGAVSVDLGIRTRGRYRRQSEVCKWAPLRLNFKKSSVKNTVFADSDKMKLVTHCRNTTRYSQALLLEHLAYRILNEVTDASFRVRLLRVTYVDTDKDDRARTEFGFLIEHKSQLAKRIGLELNEVQETKISHLDAPYTNLSSLFQYLIGNTDFSPIRAAPGEPCCHNYILFGTEAGHILPIPYDFDMSGIVDAPHSTPNPRFGLRNVRQRMYRGRCENNEHVAASVQAFLEHKPAIYELVNSNEFYRTGTRKDTLRFLNDFFALIENPKRVQSRLIGKCLG